MEQARADRTAGQEAVDATAAPPIAVPPALAAATGELTGPGALALQRSAGNAAVAGLVTERTLARTPLDAAGAEQLAPEEFERRHREDEERDDAQDDQAPRAVPADAAATGGHGLVDVTVTREELLQRTLARAAAGRRLARQTAAPARPVSPEQAALQALSRDVQAVLNRWSRFRANRTGRWSVQEYQRGRVSFDWSGLLYILHQRNATADYMTVLEQLMIPALQEAARSDGGRTPARIPGLSALTAGMWARNPPPSLTGEARRRHGELRTRADRMLQTAARNARQANITEQSLPDRRDEDYAFILGADRGGRNQFYRLATAYYRRRLDDRANHRRVITNLRSLAEVIGWVRARAARQRQQHGAVTPIGTIYLISHGHRSGTLQFGLTRNGPVARFSGQELAPALSSAGFDHDRSAATPAVRVEALGPDDGVDERTRVFIKGCDAGRDQGTLDALAQAFGGSAVVHAPRHTQSYREVREGRRVRVSEGLSDSYWIEEPPSRRVRNAQRDDDRLIGLLQDKYRDSPIRDRLPELVRLTRSNRRESFRRGIGRNDYNESVTMRYRGPRGSLPADQAERERLMAQMITDDPRMRRDYDPSVFQWRFQLVRRGDEEELVGTGTFRHFVLYVDRLDQATGDFRAIPYTNREAGNVSSRPVPATQTAVPWPTR